MGATLLERAVYKVPSLVAQCIGGSIPKFRRRIATATKHCLMFSLDWNSWHPFQMHLYYIGIKLLLPGEEIT